MRYYDSWIPRQLYYECNGYSPRRENILYLGRTGFGQLMDIISYYYLGSRYILILMLIYIILSGYISESLIGLSIRLYSSIFRFVLKWATALTSLGLIEALNSLLLPKYTSYSRR
jgi:hypothetical protein